MIARRCPSHTRTKSILQLCKLLQIALKKCQMTPLSYAKNLIQRLRNILHFMEHKDCTNTTMALGINRGRTRATRHPHLPPLPHTTPPLQALPSTMPSVMSKRLVLCLLRLLGCTDRDQALGPFHAERGARFAINSPPQRPVAHCPCCE